MKVLQLLRRACTLALVRLVTCTTQRAGRRVCACVGATEALLRPNLRCRRPDLAAVLARLTCLR
jgi:hypothetical protein